MKRVSGTSLMVEGEMVEGERSCDSGCLTRPGFLKLIVVVFGDGPLCALGASCA